jgi:hypothetical protein
LHALTGSADNGFTSKIAREGVSSGARYPSSPAHLARGEVRHYTPRMPFVTSRRDFVGALTAATAGLAFGGIL